MLISTILSLLFEVVVIVYQVLMFAHIANPKSNFFLKEVVAIIQISILFLTALATLILMIIFGFKEISNYFLRSFGLKDDM